MTEDLTIQRLRSLMETQGTVQPVELRPVRPSTPQAAEGAAQAPSFAETLQQSIREVNALKLEADKAVQDLAVGRTDDIQGTILAMEKADISFRLMMEVRNKLLSAYQEVMRTQV